MTKFEASHVVTKWLGLYFLIMGGGWILNTIVRVTYYDEPMTFVMLVADPLFFGIAGAYLFWGGGWVTRFIASGGEMSSIRRDGDS